MQISTYEHVFPLKKTCGISPLEHQASGILEDYSLLEYSLPLEIWLSFDVISLSPFDINFQEGFFWIFVTNGFGPWVTEQSSKSNVMLVEDKNHWVELDQKECRNKWQGVFPVVKLVARSFMLRLHRKDSVRPKTTDRCDRVHHRENTCHLSSLDK